MSKHTLIRRRMDDKYWSCSKCGSDRVISLAPYWHLENVESYLDCEDCGHESRLIFGVIDKKDLEPQKDNYIEENEDE